MLSLLHIPHYKLKLPNTRFMHHTKDEITQDPITPILEDTLVLRNLKRV